MIDIEVGSQQPTFFHVMMSGSATAQNDTPALLTTPPFWGYY